MKTNRDIESFLRTTTPFTDNKHTGDTNQVKCLVAGLRETLLSHRWKEASEVLSCLSHHSIWMVRNYTWKCGAEVVSQHPASKYEDIELFFRKVQTSNFYHCRQKQIEKVFHLIQEDRLEEAYNVIQDKTGKAGLKIKWEEMLEKECKKLIIAYTGIIEFALWTRRKQTENENEEEIKLSDTHGELAINNIKSVLDTPGIWDVFITCYIELMKHFNEDDDDTKSVLIRYNEQNPDNINSYLYLYQYLQFIDSPIQEQLPVLQKVVANVPSSPLVLDLHNCFHILGRKHRSTQAEYRRNGIVILFNMLDYACWQDTLQPWKLFCDDLIKVAKRNDFDDLDVINDCWRLRKSWWPQFHFRHEQAVSNTASNLALAPVKAKIVGLFFGQDHKYVKVVCEHLPAMKENIQMGICSGKKRLQEKT